MARPRRPGHQRRRQAQPLVIKGKTYTTHSGVKEETESRWLEAVAVNGTTFDLVQNWDKLPEVVNQGAFFLP